MLHNAHKPIEEQRFKKFNNDTTSEALKPVSEDSLDERFAM
jgi:hypothetical protein